MAPSPVRTKKSPILSAEHMELPDDLLIRCPLALEQLEARLFILALGRLNPDSQRLTFQLTFADVLPDGKVADRFAQLDKAQKRLMQPLKYEGLRLGKRFSHRIPLFTEMSIDQDTELVSGVFNHYLRDYLLDLSGKVTTAQLEALFRLH